MTRILLAAVFLMVLLAGAALTPKPSGATGTHTILTVDDGDRRQGLPHRQRQR